MNTSYETKKSTVEDLISVLELELSIDELVEITGYKEEDVKNIVKDLNKEEVEANEEVKEEEVFVFKQETLDYITVLKRCTNKDRRYEADKRGISTTDIIVEQINKLIKLEPGAFTRKGVCKIVGIAYNSLVNYISRYDIDKTLFAVDEYISSRNKVDYEAIVNYVESGRGTYTINEVEVELRLTPGTIKKGMKQGLIPKDLTFRTIKDVNLEYNTKYNIKQGLIDKLDLIIRVSESRYLTYNNVANALDIEIDILKYILDKEYYKLPKNIKIVSNKELTEIRLNNIEEVIDEVDNINNRGISKYLGIHEAQVGYLTKTYLGYTNNNKPKSKTKLESAVNMINLILEQQPNTFTIKELAKTVNINSSTIKRYIKQGYIDDTSIKKEIVKSKGFYITGKTQEETEVLITQINKTLESNPNTYKVPDISDMFNISISNVYKLRRHEKIDEGLFKKNNHTEKIAEDKRKRIKVIETIITNEPNKYTYRDLADKVGLSEGGLKNYFRKGELDSKLIKQD